MGIAIGTVIKYQKLGIFESVVDKYGQHWFEPNVVRRIFPPAKRRVKAPTVPASPEGKLEAAILLLLDQKVPIAEIVKRLKIPFSKVRAVYAQSQFEVDDVLPPNPASVAKLQIEKERTKRTELELEAERAAKEKRDHERRLMKDEAALANEAARRERRAKMGTSNLRPEGEDE